MILLGMVLADQLVSAAVGAAVGIIASLTTSTFVNWQVNKRDRLAWEAALKGEIAAIISVVKSRDLIALVESKINDTKHSDQVEFPQFSAKAQYFSIFNSSVNSGKIGILGSSLVSLIAQFYVVTTSVIEDLNYMAEAKPSAVSKEQGLSEMMHLLDALRKMIEIGGRIGQHV
jgi:hypothetical protein